MKTHLNDFWNLLDDMEDYYNDGFRTPHNPPPEFRIIKSGQDGIGAAASVLSSGDTLRGIALEVENCRACPLCDGRNYPVPGAGNEHPSVFIIGEGPGADEDASGVPFVGKAGQYLDKWLEAVNLDRERDIFIGNIIKCRPPGNRDPQPAEIAECLPFLERQVDLLKPRVILTLGRIALQTLTGRSEGIGKLRGRTYEYRGIPLVPTYHPSGVLRNPQYRRPVWEDMKRLRAMLDGAEV